MWTIRPTYFHPVGASSYRKKMNQIQEVFSNLKKENRAAFIPYITAGDPSLQKTGELIFTLQGNGADIIELGVPFSDPIADGPTIQRGSERALKAKTTLAKIIALAKEIKEKVNVPLVLMSYYNPILRFGLRKFVQEAKEAGIAGVIIPDLPPEEAGEIIKEAKQNDLATIFFLSPTSTKERIKLIDSVSTGFIYYVSLTGITGAREKLAESLGSKIKEIKALTKKPVAVGFGISNQEQAREVSRMADGVIVGSAIVDRIEKYGQSRDLNMIVGEFVGNLSRGCKKPETRSQGSQVRSKTF